MKRNCTPGEELLAFSGDTEQSIVVYFDLNKAIFYITHER